MLSTTILKAFRGGRGQSGGIEATWWWRVKGISEEEVT
jgi:hypothetical protein